MVENRGFAGNQSSASSARRRLQIRRIFGGKRNYGDMLRAGVLSETPDCTANCVAGRNQIRENEHRLFLLRARNQRVGVRDRLHPILQVLQPIHELGARQ